MGFKNLEDSLKYIREFKNKVENFINKYQFLKSFGNNEAFNKEVLPAFNDNIILGILKALLDYSYK